MGFKSSIFNPLRIGRSAVAVTAALAMTCMLGSAAGAAELVPQTKFRLKVVQWVPVKSSYEEWGALGGEFTVGNNGDITLPVVGHLSTNGMDTDAFGEEVAKRIQKQTGLVSKPEVSIAIVEYPPVYVTGNVVKPGEYKYREGMTVMQAIALGGGQRRLDDDASLKMLNDIKSQNDEILLATARIARLQAEIDGADKITFPDVSQIDISGAAQGVFDREKILFDARVEELDRQTKSLTELRDLFNAEINVLQQKQAANDEAVKSAEKELQGVSTLVDKGFAVAARKSEMQRVVSSMKSDSLDQATAIMRARQGIAEATRNLDGLEDRRRSDAAADLQASKALLEQTKLKRDMTQRLLFQAMTQSPDASDGQAKVSYTIIRYADGKASSMDASDVTVLLPGDVVNVSQERTNDPAEQPKAANKKQAGVKKTVSQ